MNSFDSACLPGHMEVAMEGLKPEETELIGMWLDLGNRVVGDAIQDRIDWLTETQLELLSADPAAEERLYRDPRDGRLWERTPLVKGGPSRLALVTAEFAAGKYRLSGV